MNFQIREINKNSLNELRIVTERCIETILETIPEFENNLAKAQIHLPNLNFEEMSSMIKNDFDDSSKRIMVALSEDGQLIAHSIYSWKLDENSIKYGFCFSRYTTSNFRRKGVASKLLEDALRWYQENECKYIVAHTHVTNKRLLSLFEKNGFTTEGPLEGPAWNYFLLKKELI